jgi:cell division protein FtsQ
MQQRRIRRLRDIEGKRKRPRLILILVGFVLILLSIYGTYRLFRGILIIDRIIISGNKVLSEDDVKSIAGVREGKSLLEISSSQVYHRLLGSPWIKDAVVRKGLPDRLIIWLEEASPQAFIKKDKRFYLIDESGVILEEVNNNSTLILPVLEIDYRDTEMLREALSLIKALKDMNIVPGNSNVFITGMRKEELTLVLKNPASKDLFIRIGYGRYDEKLKRLLDFAPSIRQKGLRPSVIDLRFDDRVIVKETING